MRSEVDGERELVGHLALVIVANEGVREKVIVETGGVILGAWFGASTTVSRYLRNN